MRLERARARARRYLERHGTRATIARKTGETWETVDTDAPVMVEAEAGGASVPIDALEATRDGEQFYRLSFRAGYDVRPGDRVTADSTAAVLTVATVAETSLDVYRQATALTERTALETWPLTFERWSEAAQDYIELLQVEAQASAAPVATSGDSDGATGTTAGGVVTISPVPTVALGPGDWITGIPWAPGATISRVRPVVGNRLEIEYQYTGGA